MGRRARKLAWACSAVFAMVIVRVGLSLFSYARLRKILPDVADGVAPPRAVADRCAWALTRGSRVVPGASCLTQALAGRWLLHRLGFGSTVIVGVRTGDDGAFLAHAWLVAGGDTVVGGDAEDLGRFRVLTELGRPS